MQCADLALHDGKAPKWLFLRMKELAGAIAELIIDDYGPGEFIKRLSSPFWFQAFACCLGFDWHSSGTTTTAVAALREGYKGNEIKVFGGKGKKANEIESFGKEYFYNDYKKICCLMHKGLIDGYNIYFSSIITTSEETGKEFVIINQGMNDHLLYARRYHFHSSFRFYEDQENIAGYEGKALNTISRKSNELRKTMVDIVNDGLLPRMFKKQCKITDFSDKGEILIMPKRHYITNIDLSERDIRIFEKIMDYKPKSYEEMLLFNGMGRKKIRALALIANLIYGEEIDWKDPVKYSFAHGGKDGIPFPVDKMIYDENIEILKEAVEEAKIKEGIKIKALKSLAKFISDEQC
ncbi:MAG: DUF763 domain-containing protein [Candidatus Anstonellales archaeon]